jgi:chromosome segregation ATPase
MGAANVLATAQHVAPASPGGSLGSVVRNPSPVRTSGISGENRREFHLATQSLSKEAANMKGQLKLERELSALQKRFAVTDDQLTQSKTELRAARRDLERLQLENEELLRRIHAASEDKSSATKQLAAVKEECSRMESRLTVAVSQRGKGAFEREVKMRDTIKALRASKEEADAALAAAQERCNDLESQAAALHSAVHERELDLGLVPVRGAADARQNRATVLLEVKRLRIENAALSASKAALEREQSELEAALAEATGRVVQLQEAADEGVREVAGELESARDEVRVQAGRVETESKGRAAAEAEAEKLGKEKTVMLQYITEENCKTEELKGKWSIYIAT